MSVLERIQSGRRRKPLTVAIYGVPGVGKTTFGASAPKPVIHCLERGADHLDVAKLDAPETWAEYLADVRELATAEHDFRTYVVDTIDALEVLATAHVCREGKKATLADFSWGGGYALLAQEWRVFLKAMEALRDKRAMNVVLIAHEHRKTVNDPELGSFEMYRPKLQEKAWGLTNEWCDAVMFATFDAALLEKEGERNRAIVSGQRVLKTQRGTGYVAKNRFSLPPVIDLDWRTFEALCLPQDPKLLKTQLEGLLERADDELKVKVRGFLAERGETPEALRASLERVTKILAAKAA
jgi:hypothetical protein